MQDLRSSLQAARHQHRAGAGTVLDVLLRDISDREVLDARLRSEAGVAAVFDPLALEADFTRLDIANARSLGCLPLRLSGEAHLRLGFADPWDADSVQRVSKEFGPLPELAALTSTVLEHWLGEKHRAKTATVSALSADEPQVGGPVVEFVDSAIRAGFSAGASDIHFECGRASLVVKLRLDGVMHEHARLNDIQRAAEVISRIKVLALLDITETRMPQDGRFRFALPSGQLDLRVSIMPSVFGEDAVLRLLDKAQLRERDDAVSLDLLGFDAESAERLRELAELPHGMLLVTGPTGSGKTTTVYATLSEINTGLEKIITIEDPVEYELPGVLQIPVNERKGLTFAKGLRSILRHDPDRILVGEIRDGETAEIAVQSALTGHQVFTTVHANSIFDVTGRFRHFGLDMFGFMSSLNGVVVQRLVRRLCPHCLDQREATARERRWLESLELCSSSVPRSVGCTECSGNGYRGRFVIAEVHAIDDEFRDMVTTGRPVSELREHVFASGVVSLAMQSARIVLSNQTTAEEIKRVVGWS